MNDSSAPASTAAGQFGSAGYAGDVDVVEAWEAVKDTPNSMLVDVRTKAEWNFVGVPDLSSVNKEPVLVEWQDFPKMDVNGSFVDAVAAAAPDKSTPIYFLCRSGARSKSAAIAMTQVGYVECFNIAQGFEGPHDVAHHRGSTDGWKARGLPWVQG
ncbi:MAG: rhodanese-like domain-containing protein [Pseudomonadota bacterium]|nr:rhodanese-like domain-containing protein [Pseudomonadota bacterium]